jgi:hypothetical protein
MSVDRDLHRLRVSIRRQATANLILALLAEARRAGPDRLRVEPYTSDAIVLHFTGVKTLVRTAGVFAAARRNFTVVLGCPEAWPFERRAALQPFILAPHDFAHPNSDGRGLCIDLEGILPELLPAVLYDNLRVDRFRLDHFVDRDAAAFVRDHLDEFPADRRPLYAGGSR